MPRYAPVNFADVALEGAFWKERLETVLARTVPSQHRQLEENGILESLTLPTPVPPVRIPNNRHNFTTQIFWDSDVGKWIEAASYALSHRRDADIEAKIEKIVEDLDKAQAPDGSWSPLGLMGKASNDYLCSLTPSSPGLLASEPRLGFLAWSGWLRPFRLISCWGAQSWTGSSSKPAHNSARTKRP